MALTDFGLESCDNSNDARGLLSLVKTELLDFFLEFSRPSAPHTKKQKHSIRRRKKPRGFIWVIKKNTTLSSMEFHGIHSQGIDELLDQIDIPAAGGYPNNNLEWIEILDGPTIHEVTADAHLTAEQDSGNLSEADTDVESDAPIFVD
jgi:hypothetical protein